jgi:hypothetical protein
MAAVKFALAAISIGAAGYVMLLAYLVGKVQPAPIMLVPTGELGTAD